MTRTEFPNFIITKLYFCSLINYRNFGIAVISQCVTKTDQSPGIGYRLRCLCHIHSRTGGSLFAVQIMNMDPVYQCAP